MSAVTSRRSVRAFFVASLVLSACSSSTSSDRADDAAVTLLPASTDFGAEIDVAPAPGSPSWCTDLSAVTSLGRLPDAFRQLADPALEASGRSALTSTSAELQLILPETTGTIHDTLAGVISSLDNLAAKGIQDAGAVEFLSATLIELGSEVQVQCQFELGG